MKQDLETTDKPKKSYKNFRNDMICWRNACRDLIYAGAFGGQAYTYEIEARFDPVPPMTPSVRTHCLVNGDALRDALAKDYPTAASKLQRAHAACCDYDGLTCSIIRYARWLPKRPLDGPSLVKAKRTNITEEQRIRNADAIADRIIGKLVVEPT